MRGLICHAKIASINFRIRFKNCKIVGSHARNALKFNRHSYKSITENNAGFSGVATPFLFVCFFRIPFARLASFASVSISRSFLQPRRRDAFAANKRRHRIRDACTRVAALTARGSLGEGKK